jgi:formate dehydrogenase major subunit
MTNSFREFSKAKALLCIGTNMTEAHPVASYFVKQAVENGATLIVVDPRRHALADFAQIHAQIKVGSDIAFLNGLMRVLVEEDLYDKPYVSENCEGFEELKAKVMEMPLEEAAKISGVEVDLIQRIARTLATAKPAMACYTLGITEHTCGKNNVMSVANLQMLLGNVGVEFGGVNPLRGQNNVQGACDMGALPNVFPGYQRVTDPAVIQKFEKAWGVTGLPAEVGLTIPEIMDGLPTKQIRAFYIYGENLATTEPNISHVEKSLTAAEFIVCQDIFLNETTRFAHVVLPAAAWGEDEGTFTSSERRVNRVRKFKTPPGDAKPSWWIFKELAARFAQEWPSNSGQELWDNEISVLAPALGGIKYARIEQDGLQWPCPNEEHPGTGFMHRGGKFSRGKGLFTAVSWTPPAEVADDEFPLVLSTGRRLFHYHTRTQTGRSGLDQVLSEELADISPADAQEHGVVDGQMIVLESRRGRVNIRARVSDRIPKGLVWASFHFLEGNANWLTNNVFDPTTKTAEYKACAVRIRKAS